MIKETKGYGIKVQLQNFDQTCFRARLAYKKVIKRLPTNSKIFENWIAQALVD